MQPNLVLVHWQSVFTSVAFVQVLATAVARVTAGPVGSAWRLTALAADKTLSNIVISYTAGKQTKQCVWYAWVELHDFIDGWMNKVTISSFLLFVIKLGLKIASSIISSY